jgi:hypothetical protein
MNAFRYRYVGEAEVYVPSVGKTLAPGDVLESDVELFHGLLTPVAAEPHPKTGKAAPATPEENPPCQE